MSSAVEFPNPLTYMEVHATVLGAVVGLLAGDLRGVGCAPVALAFVAGGAVALAP